MQTEMQERTMSFLDAGPVFTKGEFAAAMHLPKGSAPVGRMLRQQVAARRIKRLRREVFAAVPDRKAPVCLVLPDCVRASKCRPAGVLGHHAGLGPFGVRGLSADQVERTARLFDVPRIFATDDILGPCMAQAGGAEMHAQCATAIRERAPPAN